MNTVQIWQYESSTQDHTGDYGHGETSWTLGELKEQLTPAENGEYVVQVYDADGEELLVIQTDVEPDGIANS